MLPDENGSPSKAKQRKLMRKDFRIRQLPSETVTTFTATADWLI